MTLTTHAIVGAAAASLFPSQPVFAFLAGFASHFAIDSLPHWDYRVLSKQQDTNRLNDDINLHDKKFVLDLIRIGGDGLLGTALAVFIFCAWLFHLPVWFVVMGAWAGILPDPLQFVYWKTRFAIMTPLQRFHIWVQKGKSIHPPFYIGILYQALLVMIILVVLVSI